MTFGEQVDKSGARAITDAFLSAGGKHLDTAYIYCDGGSEAMLGELIEPQLRQRMHLATKAHPSRGSGLSADSIKHQLETSLNRLNTDCVDLFYLHSPDLNTPIEDTLYTCWQLHQSGKFNELGLSNYAAWQVAEIYHKCRDHGWMRPSVYQGMYNALTRDVERELLPCLRNYGIRFYAYNPLAGGLLTGKHHSFEHKAADGRFALHRTYRERYWGQLYFEALDRVVQACADSNTTPTAAALRWLKHHSDLDQNEDGIVIGVSGLDQLNQDIDALKAGPLPAEVVAAYDSGWDITRAACKKYFRP